MRILNSSRRATMEQFDASFVEDGENFDCDLSNLEWVEPYGVVMLGCAVMDSIERSREVTVEAPTDSNVHSYLSRMGFGDLLNRVGLASPIRQVQQNPMGLRLVELQSVGDEESADLLCNFVEEKVQTLCDAPLLDQFKGSLSELVVNIPFHANSEGLMCAQVYENVKGRTAKFAVGDWGRGIRATLEDGGIRSSTDGEAIEEAVQEGVSRFRDRGNGLSATLKDIHGLGGSISIRSGSALVTFAGSKPVSRRTVSHLPGTIVAVEMRCS